GDDRRWLHARWHRAAGGEFEPARANADLKRLLLAQTELDRAATGTLHTLCRRILADNPFESGSTFELGQAVTPDAINAELIDDLWRLLSQSEGSADRYGEIWRKAGRARREKYLRLVLAPGVGVAAVQAGPIDEIMRAENALMLASWIGRTQFASVNSKLRTRLIAL